MHEEVLLYTDAASRGNPGRTATAVVMFSASGELLFEEGIRVGNTTNNRAEYLGLLCGLSLCSQFTSGRVQCFSDSELVVRQLTGVYRIRDGMLKDLSAQIREAEHSFHEVSYAHLPRSHPRIARADRLAN